MDVLQYDTRIIGVDVLHVATPIVADIPAITAGAAEAGAAEAVAAATSVSGWPACRTGSTSGSFDCYGRKRISSWRAEMK